ncbi:unnamed protein product [Moneuplotes crassus]|uniref:Uncharacterized protein n=3 Tax=Euplotes crassus TaxID=5936 RepID=A0AAD1Y831_EUPCR|nr:unnamed protein product [Moneuplotes crassus]
MSINAAQSSQPKDEIAQRKKIPNIVVQQQEVVRLNLGDYYSGSFLEHSVDVQGPKRNISDRDVIQITQGFEVWSSFTYNMGHHTMSLQDSMRMILIKEDNSITRTFLFVITEDYLIYTMDFTTIDIGFKPKTSESYDLWPHIYKMTGWFTRKDETYCNGLNNVSMQDKSRTYLLGCKYRDMSFMIWISLSFTKKGKFSINATPQKSDFAFDKIGRNSLSSVFLNGLLHIFCATGDNRDKLQVTVYKTGDLENFEIEKIHNENITSDPFVNPVTDENLYSFNLREVVYLSSSYFENVEANTDEITHHLIISCYNNGVIFFKIDGFSGGNVKLNLTYNYNIPNIESIQTEKEFLEIDGKFTSFSFFTSVPSPPKVYEFQIDSNLNINIHKIFSSYTDELRYVCHNRITTNKDYVAHLIYDNKLQKQVIRVYNRNETNFNLGHVNIVLDKYYSQVSSMTFLSFNKCEKLFVRSPERWDIYNIMPKQLLFDSFNYAEEYENYIGNEYNVEMKSYNSINSSNYLSQSFKLFCINNNYTGAYFIRDSNSISYNFSYGSPYFEVPISDFYVGPNLKFKSQYISAENDDNITLPDVINPYDETLFAFKHLEDCRRNIFKRFKNSDTGELMISFFCISNNTIKQYIYFAENMTEYNVQDGQKGSTTVKFPHSQFIDLIISKDTYKYQRYEDLLMVLSKDRTTKRFGILEEFHYAIHIFDIDQELLVWVDKIVISDQFGGNELRDVNPLIKLDNSPYMILVGKNEKILYFITDDTENRIFTKYKTKDRVSSAFLYDKDKVYITYYNLTKVTILHILEAPYESKKMEFGENQVTGKLQITVFYVCDSETDFAYISANIGNDGVCIFLNNPNFIDIYTINRVCEFQFERQLPLYTEANNTKFWENSLTGQPVHERNGNHFYIIIEKDGNQRGKFLYIYDLFTFAHNSLVTKVLLNPGLHESDNFLFIDSIETYSTIFIYIFYGTDQYEFFEIEPKNLFVNKPEEVNRWFLSQSDIERNVYPEKIFGFLISPENLPKTSQNRLDRLKLRVDCSNTGLKIDNKLGKRTLSYTQNEGALRLSLSDMFDGFNISYNVYDPNSKNSSDLPCEVTKSEEKFNWLILDSVTQDRWVDSAFVFENLTFVIFKEHKFLKDQEITKIVNSQEFSVYNMTEELGVSTLYNFSTWLDGCEVDYMTYADLTTYDVMNETQKDMLNLNASVVIANCLVNRETISPSYQVRVFMLSLVEKEGVLTPMATEVSNIFINRRVKQIFIEKCPVIINKFNIVILTKTEADFNTVVFIVDMRCEEKNNCTFVKYYSIDGVSLSLDQFVVNSVLIIPNSTYFMLSVDNLGIVIIDILWMELAELIEFKNMEGIKDEFEITNIIPISDNGIRVMLKDIGEFSLFWEAIVPDVINKTVLHNLQNANHFISLKNQISTNIVDYSKQLIVQLNYYTREDGFYDGTFRVYNHMNRDRSKVYKEYKIGKVRYCSFLNYAEKFHRVIVICESKLYVYYIPPYPYIEIGGKGTSYNIDLNVEAFNLYSKSLMKLSINGTDEELRPSNWATFGVFCALFISPFILIRIGLALIALAKRERSDSSDSNPLAQRAQSFKMMRLHSNVELKRYRSDHTESPFHRFNNQSKYHKLVNEDDFPQNRTLDRSDLDNLHKD